MTNQVQTIEKTSKAWKICQAAGVLGIIIGATCIMIGFNHAVQPGGPVGLLVFGVILTVAAIVLYAVGRICAWWYNG